MKISGYTVIRNAIKGDYCVKETVESLLPICDEVVVGCGVEKDKTPVDDGTFAMLTELAAKEPKLRIIECNWVQPVRDDRWFVNWLNQIREQLKYPFQLTLDADEVLDERGYPDVLKAAKDDMPLWFERINYWRNARTVIPHGETCGTLVVRCGPTQFWMPSDEPYETHDKEPYIRKVALMLPTLPIIHHYGFLRKNQGMIEKCKVALVGFFGQNDERMIEAEKHPERHWNDNIHHKKPYLAYNGPHPKHCLEWLKERGAL